VESPKVANASTLPIKIRYVSSKDENNHTVHTVTTDMRGNTLEFAFKGNPVINSIEPKKLAKE
jgi:hypothetical protein